MDRNGACPDFSRPPILERCYLEEFLKSLGMTQSALAGRINVSDAFDVSYGG